jgi:hypothetical protein
VDDLEQFAQQLEKLVGDPMADAVAGRVRVVSASDPVGKARYQACALELIADAPGVPETHVHTEVVTSRRYWPKVGAVLPARVSQSHPENVDVDWDALAR